MEIIIINSKSQLTSAQVYSTNVTWLLFKSKPIVKPTSYALGMTYHTLDATKTNMQNSN